MGKKEAIGPDATILAFLMLSFKPYSPGDLANPGIKPRSPALQADSLPAELSGQPFYVSFPIKNS